MSDRKLELRIWQSKLYYLQCEAPKPNVIPCRRRIDSCPAQYGLEYHGAITRNETEQLFEDAPCGSYLIRDSQRSYNSFTLVIWFDGVAKNYMLYYDHTNKLHYVGERRFETIDLLVADGLIHLYIETYGTDVLKKIADANIYEKTPFYRMRYHTFSPNTIDSHLTASFANAASVQPRHATDLSFPTQRKTLPEQLLQNGDSGLPTIQSAVVATSVAHCQRHSVDVGAIDGPLLLLSPSSSPVEPPPRFSNGSIGLPRFKTSLSNAYPPLPTATTTGENVIPLEAVPNLPFDRDTTLPSLDIDCVATNAGVTAAAAPPARPTPAAADSVSIPDSASDRTVSTTPGCSKANTASPTLSLASPSAGSCTSAASSGGDPVSLTPAGGGKSAMQSLQERYNLPTACLPGHPATGDSKPHNFKIRTYRGPHWCDYCTHFIWGLVAQGVKCTDCGFQAHKRCSDRVPPDCLPDIKFLKRVFGVDLTSLTRAERKSVPTLLVRCIGELERRNSLVYEGLYRVSGNHDRVEELRAAFDKDAEAADISESRVPDPSILTSLIKAYLRQLPIPLITYEAYPDLMGAMRNEQLSESEKHSAVVAIIARLPPAHYESLGFFIGHLCRVAQHHTENKMPIENLARVLSPTLMISSYSDPMSCLAGTRHEHTLLELLIRRHEIIFPAPPPVMVDLERRTSGDGQQQANCGSSGNSQVAAQLRGNAQAGKATRRNRFLRNRRPMNSSISLSSSTSGANAGTK